MNWQQLEQILDLYWEGKTSLAEEKQIKEAFLRSDIPEHLKRFTNYFAGLKQMQELKLPDSAFEEKLGKQLSKTKRFKLDNNKLFSYAAVFLVLISLSFFLINHFNTEKENFEVLSPEELAFVQKHLSFMSESLAQSISFSAQNIEKIGLINLGAQTIQSYENTYLKQMQNLNKIEYLNQSVNELESKQNKDSLK